MKKSFMVRFGRIYFAFTIFIVPLKRVISSENVYDDMHETLAKLLNE